jgi:hypothetical protein
MLPERFFVGVDAYMIGIPIPIMVSDLRLQTRAKPRRAAAPVMIDSGSFTIHDTGRSFDAPSVYVDRIERYREAVGQIVNVSTYGRMCEPHILNKTDSTVERNQHLTIESYLDLRELAPHIPWLPEIQGWEFPDYHRCIDLYESYGVQLSELPAVGVGTICRRQGTKNAQQIIASVAARGIKVHAFGAKTDGIAKNHENITSADSFAWSYGARRRTTYCPHGTVRWERNCPHFLMDWRDRVLRGLTT